MMNFKNLCYGNERKDEACGSYTRYIMDFNTKLKEPILVSLSTDSNGNAEVEIYRTILAGKLGTKNPNMVKECKDMFAFYLQEGIDFEIEDTPMSRLSAGRYGKDVMITDIHTNDEYCRKGLGSYALELIQDYYKKTIPAKSIKDKIEVYAARNNFDDVVYANPIERRLGAFGELLAHAKAKVRGSRSDDAYNAFFYKNNFLVSNHAYEMPRKPIESDRHIISPALLDEGNKPALIQCFDKIVDLPKVSIKDL